MKKSNHIIALLASLVLFASAELFDIAEQEFKIPADSYYAAANLKKLNVDEKRKHAPIMILLDRERLERPEQKMGYALTLDLSASIKLAFYPIITSASLLHNFLIRNKKEREKKEIRKKKEKQPLNPNQWQIYDIEGTEFVLIVPNKFLTYYPFPSVGLKPAREKSTLDKILQKGEDQLITWLSTEKLQAKKTTFSVQDFEKIFMTPKDVINPKSLPIWDIYFSGHGVSTGRIIAGLEPTEMQQTLSWFNENIPVGVLYLSSCYAGGKNINLLQFEKKITNRYIKPLNYIMIVGSITDTRAYLGYSQKFLINFFDKAAKVAGKGKTLNDLLIAINTMNRYSGGMHGMHNIPQVWLPGGLGFQTFNVDKRVFSLGKVKIRALEYEKKPFIIVPPSTRAVLLYTETIKVPLGILPYDQEKLIVSTLQKPVPSAAQILRELKRRKRGWKGVPSVVEQLAEMKKTEDQKVLLQLIKQLPEAFWKKFKDIYAAAEESIPFLFPEIIPMAKEESQYISAIVLIVKPIKDAPAIGVMQFLRDAFLSLTERKSKKLFLIDKINGNNDLIYLLALGQAKGYASEADIKLKQLASSFHTKITLENVFIFQEFNKVAVSFKLGQSRWELTYDPKKTTYWTFRLLPPEEKKFFETLYKDLSRQLRKYKKPVVIPQFEKMYEVGRDALRKAQNELDLVKRELNELRKQRHVRQEGTGWALATQAVKDFWSDLTFGKLRFDKIKELEKREKELNKIIKHEQQKLKELKKLEALRPE